jgi:hypothetical protein
MTGASSVRGPAQRGKAADGTVAVAVAARAGRVLVPRADVQP